MALNCEKATRNISSSLIYRQTETTRRNKHPPITNKRMSQRFDVVGKQSACWRYCLVDRKKKKNARQKGRHSYNVSPCYASRRYVRTYLLSLMITGSTIGGSRDWSFVTIRTCVSAGALGTRVHTRAGANHVIYIWP